MIHPDHNTDIKVSKLIRERLVIFVAVQPFCEIFPITSDLQKFANETWKKTVEQGVISANNSLASMVCWLMDNARGGFREWVVISQREPSSPGLQRIIGDAGFRFLNPDLAFRFKEAIEQNG